MIRRLSQRYSYWQHQRRYDRRKGGMNEPYKRALASARREQGSDSGPLTDELERYHADFLVELEAGYCGLPDCAHCSDPFKTLSPEATEAFEKLSPDHRRAIEGNGSAKYHWGRLVGTVGADHAIELVEVASLMTFVKWLRSNVPTRITDNWVAGEISAAEALGLLEQFEQKLEGSLANVQSRVKQYGTFDESKDVTAIADSYGHQLLSNARGYIYKSLTDADVDAFNISLELWDSTCDAWELATDVRKLPLVGDSR